MAIEIVDFPIKNGGIFHCYVSLPEGIWMYMLLIRVLSAMSPRQIQESGISSDQMGHQPEAFP